MRFPSLFDPFVLQVIKAQWALTALLVPEASVVPLAPKAIPVHTAWSVRQVSPERMVWTAGATAPLVVTANPDFPAKTDTTAATDVTESMALVDTKEIRVTPVTKDCPAFRASKAPREIRATLVLEDLADHPVRRALTVNRVVTASTVSQ